MEGLQVDNQLENAGFPVVLSPRPIPTKSRDDRRQLVLAGLSPRSPEDAPAFHFYARRLNLPSGRDVVFFEALSCWVRPLDLKLEESVVSGFANVSPSLSPSFRASKSNDPSLSSTHIHRS